MCKNATKKGTSLNGTYVVTNEILNYVLGEIPLGTTKYLKQQYNGWLPGTTVLDRINNHSMKAVLAGLIQGEY